MILGVLPDNNRKVLQQLVMFYFCILKIIKKILFFSFSFLVDFIK